MRRIVGIGPSSEGGGPYLGEPEATGRVEAPRVPRRGRGMESRLLRLAGYPTRPTSHVDERSRTIRADSAADDHLWSRARRGDPAAFGELFTRHSKAVYNYCFRLTGSWATAEDLTSVVFLEAWRRREDAPADGVIVPWLLAVASDVTRHSARSVRRHRRLLARLPPAVIEGDATSEVSDSERKMQQILRTFRRLPRAEQDVLALCVWGGRSYAEAAVALGVPVGTVRSRLSRAHAHMQRLTSSRSEAPRTPPARPAATPESASAQARTPEPRPRLDT